MVIKGQAGYPSVPAIIRNMKLYRIKEEKEHSDIRADIKEMSDKVKELEATIKEIRKEISIKSVAK